MFLCSTDHCKSSLLKMKLAKGLYKTAKAGVIGSTDIEIMVLVHNVFSMLLRGIARHYPLTHKRRRLGSCEFVVLDPGFSRHANTQEYSMRTSCPGMILVQLIQASCPSRTPHIRLKRQPIQIHLAPQEQLWCDAFPSNCVFCLS